jgi:hypothetical protein
MDRVHIIWCSIKFTVLFQIQRSVGFKNVKSQLGRWDAVVYSNRAADQLTFPLKHSTVSFQTVNDFILKLKVSLNSVIVYYLGCTVYARLE